MNVTYLIGLEVVPQQRERFLSLLGDVLDRMRRERSFVAATLHVSPDNPCSFLLHETWRDHHDVIDVQLARPYRASWHSALPELLERPREVAIWTPLRMDTASGGHPRSA